MAEHKCSYVEELKNMIKKLAGRITPVKYGGTGVDTIEKARREILGYNPGCCKIVKKNDTTDYNTSYNYFDPLYGTVEMTAQNGDCLYQDTQDLESYGDRGATTVTGIRVGEGVNFVRVTGSVRYRNNATVNTAVHTIVYRYRPGVGSAVIQTIVGVNIAGARLGHTLGTLVDVQEGDLISIQAYKGEAGRDIEVLASTYATQLCVEAIG